MKKLLFFISLLILFSCEKQDVDCWVCQVDAITMVNGEIVGTCNTFTHPCGMSAERIFQYEKDGTSTTTFVLVQSGYMYIKDVTVNRKTDCKKR